MSYSSQWSIGEQPQSSTTPIPQTNQKNQLDTSTYTTKALQQTLPRGWLNSCEQTLSRWQQEIAQHPHTVLGTKWLWSSHLGREGDEGRGSDGGSVGSHDCSLLLLLLKSTTFQNSTSKQCDNCQEEPCTILFTRVWGPSCVPCHHPHLQTV